MSTELKLKAILKTNKKKNSEGQYPVYMRLHVNGKRTYQSTGYWSTEKLWNDEAGCAKPDHPEASLINAGILRRKAEYNQEMVQQIAAGKEQTVAVREIKRKKRSELSLSMDGDMNFFKYVRDRNDHHKATKYAEKSEATCTNYEKMLVRIERCFNTNEILFSEITHDFLDDLVRKLHAKELHPNTVRATIKDLMVFINDPATKKKVKYLPALGYKAPKHKKTAKKDRLIFKELDKIEEFARNIVVGKNPDRNPERSMKQAAIYFLFGCYTGFRQSDWRPFDITNHWTNKGIMGIDAEKNKRELAIPTHHRLANIIEMMEEMPLTISYGQVMINIAKIVAHLKINKHITTHCARRTFAVTICSEQGISAEVCAKLMGITVKVCLENYYETTLTKVADEVKEHWQDMP